MSTKEPTVTFLSDNEIEIVDTKNRRVVLSRKESATVAYNIFMLLRARFGMDSDGKFVVYMQGAAST